MSLTRGHILGFGLLTAVAIYATWPGDNSLDYSSCEPKGALSQLSEGIYGRFFWEQALTRARGLANMKTFQSYLDDAERESRKGNQLREEIYAKHPSLAPTNAERTAERLRQQADRIEAQEGMNRLFAMEREIKAKGLNCVQVITEKLRAM